MLQQLLSCDGISLVKALERRTETYVVLDSRNMNFIVFGYQKAVAAAEEKLVRELLSLNESMQLEILLRGYNLPPDLMREAVRRFGLVLRGLKETNSSSEPTAMSSQFKESYLICLCELEDPYRLKDCKHNLCIACLIDQCVSAKKFRDGSGFDIPMCYTKEGCDTRILLVDLRSLLPQNKLDKVLRASLWSFTESSGTQPVLV